MKATLLGIVSGLVLAFGLLGQPVRAQEAGTSQTTTGKPAAQTSSGFEVLVGRWVRPDGGYVVTIEGVDADGNLEAIYSNPRFLPFEKAQATREGKTIKVFLELRAGGYNGSTYTLTYDPEKDILAGVYYQAVARQKYNIFFVREK